MVSRRNFFMLTAVLLVVLFLFQAEGIAKNSLNDADTNVYASQNETGMQVGDAFSTEDVTDALSTEAQGAEQIVFLGDRSISSVYDTVYQWCIYSKRGLTVVRSAADCAAYLDRAEAVLIDSGVLDLGRDVEILQGYVDQGANLVFCNLPDVEDVGASVELEELLGIKGIYMPRAQLTGVQLFDGFLLGGGQIYQAKKAEEQKLQDMNLTVPWYLTLDGNKTYMIGLVDELESQKGEIKNEYAPGLIWCYSKDGRGRVFSVNGNFMDDVTGIGILEAMMYEVHDYELYPIVNAQNLSIVNYPSFAEENSEEIEKRYSRRLQSLYRDVIWQGISAVAERNENRMTSFLAPQYDYADKNEPSADTLIYYAKLFRERRMEIGLSLQQLQPFSLEEKVAQDLSFLNEHLEGYVYRAAYVGQTDDESRRILQSKPEISSVTTILTDYDRNEPLFSYDGKWLVQHGTNDAFSHTYTDDFRMRSIESALGYTSIIMNADRVAYPQSDEDGWEKLYEQFSGNLLTHWKPYSLFEKTTISQSDVRIRRFLSLNYMQSRQENEITVAIANFEEEAYFILRTHGEDVASVENGIFQKLEEDAWLIGAKDKKISITLEKEQQMEYYY